MFSHEPLTDETRELLEKVRQGERAKGLSVGGQAGRRGSGPWLAWPQGVSAAHPSCACASDAGR